jgi:hypothetical protein
MHVSRHREFSFSVGEHEEGFIFLQAECFSSAIKLFARIDKFDITFAGGKWNGNFDLSPFHPCGIFALNSMSASILSPATPRLGCES